MSESSTLMDRLDGVLSRFTERERLLLGVMIVVLSTLGALAVTLVLRGRLTELNDTIEQKRATLDLLINQSDEYLRNSEANEALRAQLRANDLRLSTFIEGRAGRASIDRPREFRDNQQDLEGGVTMYSTTAEFSSVELSQLQRLLQSIEESEELVFTRQIAVSPARRAEGLELELTLATFKQETAE